VENDFNDLTATKKISCYIRLCISIANMIIFCLLYSHFHHAMPRRGMFGNSGLQLPSHLIINIDIINFLLVKYTASNESCNYYKHSAKVNASHKA